MQDKNAELMREVFEDGYDEEWTIVLNTGGKYTLSRKQALVIQEAIAQGSRGVVMFKTFSISIPYVAEFFRSKRFLIGLEALPESTKEEAWSAEDSKRAVDRLAKLREKLKELRERSYSETKKPVDSYEIATKIFGS